MTTNVELTGYLESAQWLQPGSELSWDQRELLDAARRAELRNTGWPVGVVMDTRSERPNPTAEGIEVKIGDFESGEYDYWLLRTDGRFYFLRKLEEETKELQIQSSEGVPKRAIWWDIRVWRIAEVLLHSATLYRELRIPADLPYFLSINHGGLANREFYCSSINYFTRRGRFSTEPTASWQKRVTQDLVIGGLNDLTFDVANRLFVLFDFAEVPRVAVDEIVDRFLQSRL